MVKIIRVTQEDIDTSIIGSFSRCPIAQALKRELQEKEDVYVAIKTFRPIFWIGEDVGPDILLPEETRKFICDFDEDLPVEPFEFQLENIPS